MSEKALLERFDLVADYPENIPLLRRYIVDLAVRGKLLPASEQDISSKEMLSRIAAKAETLIKQGQLKKSKPLPAISAEELPPAYVAHCQFERLGNVANLQKGLTGIQGAVPGEFPLVVTAAARSTCDHYDFDGAAAAIIPMVSSTGHGHASLNRLHYQEGKFALGTILCAVFPIDEELLSARFLFEYLTAFKDDLLVSKMNGTANVTLTVNKIAEVPVPLIAPAVQRRIEELMELCDQLVAAQAEREAQRDRLIAASLSRINVSQSVTGFRDAARFYLDCLPRLATRSEHFKQLRQTILNTATRGYLVPQDPNDEPASAALDRCDTERELTAENDRRADSDAQVLLAAEERWEVPPSWLWRGLADLALFIDYRGQTPTKIEAGVRLITAKNVKQGFINFSPEEFLAEDAYASWMTRGIPHDGDVLFTTEAPMGNAAVVRIPERFALAQRVINFRLYGALSPDFLVLQILSDQFKAVLDKTATGLTAKGIKAAKLKRLPVAIPPLTEQHRIVAKVDKLMSLCNRLETQLATTEAESRRLLEAVLRDVLASDAVVAE